MRQWLFFGEPQLKAWWANKPFKIKSISEAICKIHEDFAKSNNAIYCGQKTPRFIRNIDLFNQSLKSIKWILIYRDPRAVVASMLKSSRHTYSVCRACKRWLYDNNKIIDIMGKGPENFNGNILVIKYEELIENFDDNIKFIFSYLDLEPIDKKKIFTNGKTLSLKGSKFEINAVRSDLKPQVKKIDSWKNKLNENQIYLIENICAKEMQFFHYKTTLNGINNRIGYLVCKDFLVGFKDMLIFFEYMRKWPQYIIYTVLRKIIFFIFKNINIIMNRK